MSFPATAFLLHLTSITLMYKGYQFGSTIIPGLEWVSNSKCGQWQFLTIQSILASIATMVFGLFTDITSSKTTRKVQRQLLAVALPTSCIVTLIYWSLLLFFPTLLYASPGVELDPNPTTDANPKITSTTVRLPLIYDLFLHAVPALSLSLEFLFFQQPYSKHTLASGVLLAHAIAGAFYGSVVEYCAFPDGRFPYPFFTMSPVSLRIFIYASGILLTTASLWTLNWFHPSARCRQVKC